MNDIDDSSDLDKEHDGSFPLLYANIATYRYLSEHMLSLADCLAPTRKSMAASTSLVCPACAPTLLITDAKRREDIGSTCPALPKQFSPRFPHDNTDCVI